MNFQRVAIYCAASFSLLGFGCNPLIVGPVQIELPAGEASLPLPTLKQGAPVSFSLPFCEMPSEDEIAQMVQEVGGFDVSRFVRVDAIELQETRFEASTGDFGFANAARLDLELFDGETFELGTASAPQGFGSEIVLRPGQAVDVLAIIRSNDGQSTEICPLLRGAFTLNAVSLPATQFEVKVVLDAYVALGIF